MSRVVLYGLDTVDTGFEEKVARSPAQALSELAVEGVVAGIFAYNGEKDLELAANAADLYRDLTIFLVVDQEQYSPALYRKTIASGVDVTTYSDLTARMSQLSSHAAKKENKNAERLEDDEIVRSVEEVASRQVHPVKQLIAATYSRDGGVGKSTFVATAGVYMAEAAEYFSSEYKVVAVDLDLEKEQGSLAEILCVPARTTVSAWVDVDSARLKWEDAKSLLVKHKSGLWVLPAPQNTSELLIFTPEKVERIIKALARHFDAVLIDLGYGVADTLFSVLRFVPDIFFFLTPDKAKVKGAVSFFRDTGPSNDIETRKIRTLLNEFNKPGGLAKKHIEGVLGRKFSGILPDDPTVLKALNAARGDVAGPGSPYYDAVSQYMAKVMGPGWPAGKEKRTSLAARLAGLFRKKGEVTDYADQGLFSIYNT
ncbi:MAG: AAA family ATPase [Bacillota bacterium]